MVGRSPARYLAPIALAVAVVGTYVIVHKGLTHKPRTPGSPAAGTVRRPHRRYGRARFYVVQPGDSLSGIADRTGIALATIEALNPRVDPNSLQTSQRLRLRR